MLRQQSVLDHLSHALLHVLHLLLLLFLVVLAALLWSHLCKLLTLELLLTLKLFHHEFLLSFVLFFAVSTGGVPAVFLALDTSLVGKLHAHNFVNDREHCLQHFQSLAHRLIGGSNFNPGSHEHRVLVVDLLVGDVELLEAVSVLLQNFADALVNDLVGHFLVLSEHDEVVLFAELAGLLLVGGRGGHGQVVGFHSSQEVLEMLVDLKGTL